MFDIGWSEMALIAIVALIFIGPKELPAVLRNVGKWVTAARNMAREFQGHVDDLVKETELDEVRRNIRENTSATLNDLANHIDPDRSLREGLDPDKLAAGDAKPAASTVTPEMVQETASLVPPPTQEEIAAGAASAGAPLEPVRDPLASGTTSIGEPVAPVPDPLTLGADYHPPTDAPTDVRPAAMPHAAAPPVAGPTAEPAKAAVESAKNAGAVEPGRA